VPPPTRHGPGGPGEDVLSLAMPCLGSLLAAMDRLRTDRPKTWGVNHSPEVERRLARIFALPCTQGQV